MEPQLTRPVFLQRPIRTVPLPEKPQKPIKLERCFIKHPNKHFDDSVNLYGVLSVEIALWQTHLGSQVWQALQAGASGGKKKITKFEWPCLPTQLFYAVLLPVLSSEGQSILIDRRRSGVVTRTVEETNLKVLESFLAFQNRHSEAGIDNCRVVKRKGITFYNIATKLSATHTLKQDGDIQYARFEITVCSLNPEAVVTLDNSIPTTESNITQLQRYCRSYPIKAKRAGIATDKSLIDICRVHAKRNLESRASSSSQDPSTVASTSSAIVTSNTNITASQEGEGARKRQRPTGEAKQPAIPCCTISTINPEELP
jgi:hypothetical protein